MKRLVYVLTFFLSLSAIGQDANQETEFRYFDPKSKILYDFSNDDTNFYLSLKASDRASIMKIIRTGLSIYFDEKGKKKRNISFEYPMSERVSLMDLRLERQESDEQTEFSASDALKKLKQGAEFVHFKSKELLDPTNADSDIKAAITTSAPQEILYQLTIPIERISADGIDGLSNMTVGVVSGKFESLSSTGNISTRRRQIRPGTGGSPAQRPSDSFTAMTSAINFWFKPELK